MVATCSEETTTGGCWEINKPSQDIDGSSGRPFLRRPEPSLTWPELQPPMQPGRSLCAAAAFTQPRRGRDARDGVTESGRLRDKEAGKPHASISSRVVDCGMRRCLLPWLDAAGAGERTTPDAWSLPV